MLRTALATLALALAAPALAADTDVQEAKAERKALKKYSKSVDKAVAKWQKGFEKGNEAKMAKADADLDGIIGDELLRLRREGVPTKKPFVAPRPEPHRVVDGERTPLADLVDLHPDYRADYEAWLATEPAPPDFPVKEAFRDDLVVLRDINRAAAKGDARRGDLKEKDRLLADLDRKVENRYARADARYRRAKG